MICQFWAAHFYAFQGKYQEKKIVKNDPMLVTKFPPLDFVAMSLIKILSIKVADIRCTLVGYRIRGRKPLAVKTLYKRLDSSC